LDEGSCVVIKDECRALQSVSGKQLGKVPDECLMELTAVVVLLQANQSIFTRLGPALPNFEQFDPLRWSNAYAAQSDNLVTL